jgi:exodeoxyribonuclease V alpha subunit
MPNVTEGTLEGSVERVTYHNDGNGYSVLKIKKDGEREPVTLVGFTSAISAGEFIRAEGSWTQHKEFGKQFKAESIKTVEPTSLIGIQKYLGSGMVKGIGPHFAEKLVKTFGAKVFEVIDQHPERLKKVRGLGVGRIARLSQAWKEQRAVREIMVFLQANGVSTSKSVRIYKTYGEAAIEKVKANPYRLADDISGIGFKGADLIATNLGIAKDSILRARAGLQYMLNKKVGEGHCAFPQTALLTSVQEELEIPPEKAVEALALEIQEGTLVQERHEAHELIFLPKLLKAEFGVAREIMRLLSFPLPWTPVDTEKAIPWIEKKMGVTLAAAQKSAVSLGLHSKVCVITGGPGTGKTTLTRAIVSILEAKKVRIVLCSPTGRAAKRLSECTGREAKTIHRLLGVDRSHGGFLHGRSQKLAADLVLLDEASMVDLPLMESLLEAISDEASLLIVGDADQIPSVGPGRVLQSLLASKVIASVQLEEIFRQASHSRIIEAAHQVNHGIMPNLKPEEGSDFYFIECAEPTTIIKRVIEMMTDRIPKKFKLDPLKDIQVLCPMHRSALGARSLNAELQKVLNPNPVAKVERFGWLFGTGDKVMVTQNDYDKEVFNGDIGFITRIDSEDQIMEIDFEGTPVQFEFSELDTLQPAFAMTIHKAQGSEYPAIILPLATQHYMMLKRNLVYTAITRGKKLVIVIGQKRALAIAVHESGEHRWTRLEDRLRELAQELIVT